LDFKLVVEKLITAFKDEGIRYALMGGFALGLWGVPRATVDVDFLVNKDDMGKVNEIIRREITASSSALILRIPDSPFKIGCLPILRNVPLLTLI
jgi:hypothetical protein